MKAVEIVVDTILIAGGLVVGIGYAVVEIFRHRRRPTPEPELHPDAPSAVTWSDLATPDEVQDASRKRMLRQFNRIAKTMPDVKSQFAEIIAEAEEKSQ